MGGDDEEKSVEAISRLRVLNMATTLETNKQ